MCFEEKQGQIKQKTHFLTGKDSCTKVCTRRTLANECQHNTSLSPDLSSSIDNYLPIILWFCSFCLKRLAFCFSGYPEKRQGRIGSNSNPGQSSGVFLSTTHQVRSRRIRRGLALVLFPYRAYKLHVFQLLGLSKAYVSQAVLWRHDDNFSLILLLLFIAMSTPECQ